MPAESPNHANHLGVALAEIREQALLGTALGLERCLTVLSSALNAEYCWLMARGSDGWTLQRGPANPPNPDSGSAPRWVDEVWGQVIAIEPVGASEARVLLARAAPWTAAEQTLLHDVSPWLGVALRLTHAQRLQEEAEGRYEALLSAGFEGLCMHKDGVLLEVNQALADLYGYSRDEMLGMHIRQLAPPEVAQKIGRIIRRGDGEAYETEALCSDGSIVPLEARGKNSRFRGEHVRVAGFRDLRERRRAEEALVEARRAAERASASKTEFLGNMSHELRTPMQGVLGLAHLIQQTDLDPQQTHYIQTLEQSAKALLTLLNDLLDITRIEERRLDIRCERFDLPAVVAEAAQVVRAGIQAKGVALKVQLAEGLSRYYLGDSMRIRQVLVNLLGNAAKFTHDGTVSLVVQPSRDHVVFRVRDTGIGMSQTQLSQVFTRFSQADSSITRKYGGSGLGLSISRGLVRAMGGHMSAQSHPGRGSVFEFRLALVSTEAPAEVGLSGALEQILPKLQILVAEDNLVNQLVIRKLLERDGHDVTVVADGALCVERVNIELPDVILMDMQMPTMDGLQATQTLRELGVSIPIIALTANAMPGDRDRCLASGMNDYLTKPIQLDQLQRVLLVHFGVPADALPVGGDV